MDLTNGRELVPCFLENLQSSASKGGINGWIQALKKLNGLDHRTKNCYNSPEYFQVNGEQLLLLWEGLPLNAINDTKNYWI
jgi:hypothetical protein